jgi:putative PEP-CTERM system TPR-repeat lipoprotein
MKTGLPSPRRHKTLAAAIALVLLAGCDQAPTPGEYLELAQQAYAQGNTNEAVLSLKQALQADPANGAARKLLAQLYVDDGNGKAASIELDKAVSSGVAEADIALLRLNALMLERKFEDAIGAVEQFRGGERPAQEVAEMIAIRGLAQMSLEQGDAADASFTEALGLDGNNGMALTGQAQRAIAARKVDDAVALAKKATEVSPGFAPGWSLLGDLMRVKEDPQAAEAAYSEAITKRSQNANDLIARAMVRLELDDRDGAAADVKTLRQRGFVNPYALFGEGLLAMSDGKLLPAAEKFQEVLGKFPNFARVSCYAGMSLAATERQNQSIAYLESCLNAYPQADTVRRTLAASYSSSGQREKVEPLLQPLVEREKPDPAALELLAQIKLTNNDPKAAADLLKKVVAGEQKDSRGLVNLGLVLTAAGDLGAAKSAFAEAAAVSEEKFDPALVEAQALLQTGRTAEGMTRLEAVLRERPEDTPALTMLGIAKAQTGDLAGARKLFEKSLQIASDDSPVRINLANVLTRQGETARALKELEQVLERAPATAQALGMATALDVQAGEPDRARTRIAAAEKAKPGDADVLLVKARFAQTQGQRDEARQLLQQVLKDAGDRSDVLRELGQLELARGEAGEATQLFERLVGRPDRQPQDFLLLAQAAEARGRLSQAREAIGQALALVPDYPAARHAEIRLDLRESRATDARRKLDALKAMAPTGPIPDLLATEGQLLLLEKKPEQAVDFYRQAFEAQPSGERAVQLARVQAGTGQGEAAMKTLEGWVEKNPKDFRVRFVLADSYSKRNEHTRAVALYEALLGEAPQDVLVLNNLAWLLRAEDPARALELANKANAIAPRSPAVLDTLGMLLLDQDKMDPALAALRKANELLPDNPDLKLHLAMALVRTGGGEEARKLLRGLEPEQFDGEQREAYETLKDDLQI